MKTKKSIILSLLALTAISAEAQQVVNAIKPDNAPVNQTPNQTPIASNPTTGFEGMNLVDLRRDRPTLEQALNKSLPLIVRRGDLESISLNNRRIPIQRLVVITKRAPLADRGEIEVITDGITRGTIHVSRRSSHIVTVNDYVRTITFRHLNGGAVKVKKISLMYSDNSFGGGYYGGGTIGSGFGGNFGGGFSALPRCSNGSDEAGMVLNDVADIAEILRDHATVIDSATYVTAIIQAYVDAQIAYETGGIFQAKNAFINLLAAMDRAEPWFRVLVSAPLTQYLGEDALIVRGRLKRLLAN
jgi:hypothetical protein